MCLRALSPRSSSMHFDALCNTRLWGACSLSSTSVNDTNYTDMAGNCRWTHRAQAFKKIAIRLRSDAGFTRIGFWIHSREHAIVTRGMSSMHWRDLRRIRATSPYVSQTLYRLKCNRFPLWNQLANNLSCPNPSCRPIIFAPASHIISFCPLAQRRWRTLFDVWRRLS